VVIGAANRDPSQFADPEALDLGRTDNRHLSFGLGPHYCVGAMLARLEGQLAIQTLVKRFPAMRLQDDELEWRPDVLLRGMKHLRVALTG
jgi:cytochrome P450